MVLDGWRKLGQQVISRRVELGWRTREAFVSASGLSRKTLGEIERGDRASYDPSTIAAIEQTLRWPVGRVACIVNGGDPMRPSGNGYAVRSSDVATELALMLDPSSPLSDDDREIIDVMVGRFLEPYRRKLRELRANG